jgi:hypothetical protein
VRSFLHPGAINSAYGREKVRKYADSEHFTMSRDRSINQSTIRAEILVDNVKNRTKGTFCNAQGSCVRRSRAPEAIKLP